MIAKVVSGGQTGVDRAALDVALELGVPHGGWCPAGRRAEDGRIPDRYQLTETPSRKYPQRTRWNVRDSDGTLILTRGPASDGTLLTVKTCQKSSAPFLVVDLGDAAGSAGAVKAARAWLADVLNGRVLNVAGPRESGCPGIYEQARAFLREALRTTLDPLLLPLIQEPGEAVW
jgi:hypothetical protein